MATTVEGPRAALPDEYDELMDLAEQSFRCPRGDQLNRSPQLRRDHFAFENHFVMKENGRLVSHVGLYPMDAIADRARVRLGGIGDIATHSDYRGKRCMMRLLDYAMIKLKEKAIPLAILWGDTQRYRHFGWETAGSNMVFHISQRSVGSGHIGRGVTIRGYDKERDLDRIVGIHEREPLRIKRTRRDYERLLDRAQDQAWVGEENHSWAYAVVRGNDVVEFGGRISLVAKLFSFILHRAPNETLSVHAPHRDTETVRMLYRISAGWQILTLGMIKIVDLRQTLLSFRGQIADRACSCGIERGSRITLEMRDSHQVASLVTADELKIEEKKAPDVVSLTDIEMVRLLFGPRVEDFGKSRKQKRLLSSLFPLDFYVWKLDHV